eukprot:COSAG06_NODE_3418_length_5371_cov_196.405918_3_plen_235_part_00
MEIEITKGNKLGSGFFSVGVPANKIVLGLPFFGYDFACANAAPVPYPRKGGVPPPCNLAQPPQYPMIGYHDAMTLLRTENVTSSPDHAKPELRFHEKYASAWFVYSNSSTGQRHQVWFNDPQCVPQHKHSFFPLPFALAEPWPSCAFVAMSFTGRFRRKLGGRSAWGCTASPSGRRTCCTVRAGRTRRMRGRCGGPPRRRSWLPTWGNDCCDLFCSANGACSFARGILHSSGSE